jgi:hypothetical protein
MKSVLGLTLLLFLSACRPVGPASPEAALPLPGKDDVALVEGRRLTLSFFKEIEERLGPPVSVDTTLWVGLATLVIQNDSTSRARPLDTAKAYEISLYALGRIPAPAIESSLKDYIENTEPTPTPGTIREIIDQHLARSVVRHNARVLAELRRTVR